jgi:threonine 3-dehydrogenase
MAKLVTGGTGYIGSETVRQLVARGEEVVVFDIALNVYRIKDVENKVKIIQGDVGNFSEVLNVVKDNKIDAIYHMGSMLAFASENNPWASFRTNVEGTYYILEAARLFDVKKVLVASSRGTFGLGIGEEVDDWTIQRPIVFYGWGKLYSEGMGRWYSGKFGMDFHAIRYPMMIAPGVRTRGHWAPAMIEDAIKGKPHFCEYGTPSSNGPWLYQKDAARAAVEMLDAPREKTKTMNYNIAGTQEMVSAKALEAYLKERYPGFEVTYKSKDEAVQKVTTKVFSDSYARKEWGWKSEFDTMEIIVEQFIKDAGEYPERYNINP